MPAILFPMFMLAAIANYLLVVLCIFGKQGLETIANLTIVMLVANAVGSLIMSAISSAGCREKALPSVYDGSIVLGAVCLPVVCLALASILYFRWFEYWLVPSLTGMVICQAIGFYVTTYRTVSNRGFVAVCALITCALGAASGLYHVLILGSV